MRGSVFRRCHCRDVDGREMGRQCPKLTRRDHGAWYYRYDAPPAPGRKRRQPVEGPWPTRKRAEEELAVTLARLGEGAPVLDRSVTVAVYLDGWVAGKLRLKPKSAAAAREAIALYWKPALGHLRLVDLRDQQIAGAIAEIMLINKPGAGPPSEMGRRLAAVRTRAAWGPGREGTPGPKSVKPLSPARVLRIFAVLTAALSAAVPSRIRVNPCDGIELPHVPKVRPLPWSAEREAAFRAELDRRERAAGPRLTKVAKQKLWAAADLRPSAVMVWLPAPTGAFLDAIEGERLYALFALAAYCGLRQGELLALRWPETDLDAGTVTVLEGGSGDGPKSDAGERVVPLPPPVTGPLRDWRKQQAADRLAWAQDWPGSGLVFTRPDGSPVPGQWLSVRFATLAFRCGLPPVRFHDLRHGAASLCKAAKLDSRYIAGLLGHSRSAFSDATYVHLFPDVLAAAAEQAAAVVPRRGKS